MKEFRQKTALLLIFITALSSCKSTQTTSELKNHFSGNQIKDLNKLNNFFISEYLHSNANDFEKAFRKLHKNIYSFGLDTIINQVDFKKQLKLYNTISKSTFDEIWELMINSNPKFLGEEYLVSNIKGAFLSFLQQISNTNGFASDCYDGIDSSGDFNLIILSSALSKNKIDFKNFNNQLIISIYYLSMVDDNERDVKTKKRRQEFEERVMKLKNKH